MKATNSQIELVRQLEKITGVDYDWSNVEPTMIKDYIARQVLVILIETDEDEPDDWE